LRLFAAAVLVVPTLVVSFHASAAPSKEDVQAAQSRLATLQHELEQASERYNDAAYRLTQIRDRLATAKSKMDTAEATAAASRDALSDRAVDAYTTMGSQLDVLLDAEDFSQFSDRLTFMGAIASSDATLASEADADRQRAEWAAAEYADALAEQQAQLQVMAAEKASIARMVADQQALAAQLGQEYQAFLARQQAAATPTTTSPPTGGSSDGIDYHPPPATSAGGVAVNAAMSKIGAPYVSGAAGPSAFDCSGLTSWAWAQAGVSLPHSAAAQFASLPRVSLSDVAVGDIIYYGNFGPHVALYAGGGRIVHTRNPGPDGGVQVDSMYGYDRPWGAVRPG
jgi:cell wall-associated NlpC family hydrolase